MNRAERRRALRENGRRRVAGKRGRRAEVRAPEAQLELSEIARRGFVIATPRIQLPGKEQG